MKAWCVLATLAMPLAAQAAEIPPLPVAVSNNATAALPYGEGFRLYSFNGLLAGRTWRDVVNRAFEFDSTAGVWTELAAVPGGGGRLASVAATVGEAIYLFGGYTVAPDGSERSLPALHRFEPATRSYHTLAPMPVPVDDAVAVAWRDRYLILVSGWHDTDNVDAVQVYDTAHDTWLEATPWPGDPVFGHAGGLVDDSLVICDGVRVVPAEESGRRSFRMAEACFRGDIDPDEVTTIRWQPLPAHPGPARYRMAATGLADRDRVIFAGGSDNPYNYDGIGYDGEPSAPSAEVFAYDLGERKWVELPALDTASMDHRNWPRVGDRLILVGGMGSGQAVTGRVQEYRPRDR